MSEGAEGTEGAQGVIRIIDSSNRLAVAQLLSATRVRDRTTEQKAARIIAEVRRGGDRAVRRFARELDGRSGPLEVPRQEWASRAAELPRETRTAIRQAARHIRQVARRQLPRSFRIRVAPGVSVEQRVIPLDRVGCYVPGGRFPLPSSLLMTAVPARAAGVKEVIAISPSSHPAVFAAALEAGVDRFFQLGGAHGIAALAYGTDTVPRVDKIVGPGSRWVSAAKALVTSDCAIDFYAGPTEIVIVSSTGQPTWIAADLIAQAEHDPQARAVLITPSRRLATRVVRVVAETVRAGTAAHASLQAHGGIVVTRNTREAIALANRAAPEHLVVDTEGMARQVTSAGAVFIGPWSAQVAGDYAIGSNHVLPTAGAARFRGGLHAADFVRLVSFQRVTRRGLARLAPTVLSLARAEGLHAHARSIEVRV